MDHRDGSLARLVFSLILSPVCRLETFASTSADTDHASLPLQSKYRTTASTRDDVISRTCATRPSSRRRCRPSLQQATATVSTIGSAVRQTSPPWTASWWTASQTRGAGATDDFYVLLLLLRLCLYLSGS